MHCTEHDIDPDDFQQFMLDQCDEMKRHKWIESEKAGRDLGNQAIREWICKYAKEYRRNYIKRNRD